MTEREARIAIATKAQEWIGTPFFPKMGRKGIGADCVHFVLGVFKEAGIAPPEMALPHYTLDGGLHRARSLVIDWLSECPCVLKEDAPSTGSVVTFQFGRVPHHVGIMIDSFRFLHSIRNYGVTESSIDDSTFKDKFTSSWKPNV